MNRELKFRVWDKILKQFLFDHRKTSLFFSRHKDISLGDLSVSNYIGDKDSIVQQFTGLKDKNGKEIYEGDIIERTDPSEEREGDEINIGKVLFSQDAAAFMIEWIKYKEFRAEKQFTLCDNSELSHLHKDNLKLIKIIGNVFGNPELLEGARAGQKSTVDT